MAEKPLWRWIKGWLFDTKIKAPRVISTGGAFGLDYAKILLSRGCAEGLSRM